MKLNWNELGDISIGRKNLGKETSVEMYRLMQFSLRKVLEEKLGAESCCKFFYQAGNIAGRTFCSEKLDINKNENDFVSDLHQALVDHKIGILRVESHDAELGEYIVSISEDLDCSGLEIKNETVCDFDEGFLAGIMSQFIGQEYTAKEIDCWALGEGPADSEYGP